MRRKLIAAGSALSLGGALALAAVLSTPVSGTSTKVEAFGCRLVNGTTVCQGYRP